jgi:KDO2-lipid IV(A) lauroyltransferase
MVDWFSYAAALAGLKLMGLLPRSAARSLGASLAAAAFFLHPYFRRAALFNLQLAFPEWPDAKRRAAVRTMTEQVGWMVGEFSQFPKYDRAAIERIVVIDGLENFEAARNRGKGVLFLTGHMSAWELAPFAQARYGNPLHFLVRPLANARLDGLINGYRGLAGNQPIEKNRSARAILRTLSDGGTVGILADHNTALLEEAVFVDFFGIPASTTSGLARLALRTAAAVVPGFLAWDASLGKYRLGFEPAVELSRTGDEERDVRENTQRFTRVIEDFVRAHPDQWLWVHKRWKTRPPGAPAIYPF